MRRQTITWLALPNGIQGGRLRLSVFVSPKLWTDESDPRLEKFPDFLAWPSKDLQFLVQFEGGPTIRAKRVDPSLDTADRIELWTSLFKPGTYIRPYEYSGFENSLVRSYPVRHIMTFLKRQYQSIATNTELVEADEFPSIESLSAADSFKQVAFNFDMQSKKRDEELFRGLDVILRGRKDRTRTNYQRSPIAGSPAGTSTGEELTDEYTREELDSLRARLSGFPSEELTDQSLSTKLDFLQLKLFHQPHNARVNGSYNRLDEIKVPEIDFHQMVSTLGQYPEILRRLGLIIDLEVPVEPSSIPPSSTVRVIPTVIPDWSDEVETDPPILPKTRYIVSTNGFMAMPRQSADIQNGMLTLNLHFYDIIQIDTDGAAIKAMALANNLMRMSGRYRTRDTPTTSSVSSLRSAGFSIVRKDRPYRFMNALQIMAGLNQMIEDNQEIILNAEDVIRGYRVDVWDTKTNQWHSLCKRKGTYNFRDSDIPSFDIEDEEGFVSTGVTRAADESSDDLYLQESLFQWTGWSLSAPRPGKTILPDDTTDTFTNRAETDFKLETSFRPMEGSLPRLRFGVGYRLRARIVDMAGNSFPLDSSVASSSPMTQIPPPPGPPFTYLRYEPVGSPFVVLGNDLDVSEFLERLVIRSYNSDTSQDLVTTDEVTKRHIAPPQTSQLMAEMHGMFDDMDPETSYNLIRSREGSFEARIIGETDAPPEEQTKVLEVHSEAELEIPYLPDPLAFGAKLRTVSRRDKRFFISDLTFGPPVDKITFYPSGESWPNAKSFVIELKEGTGSPELASVDGSRVLTVPLPKAEVAKVRISSYFENASKLQLMGIWQWIKEAGRDAALLDAALNGRHWMLTPFRTILLVHAVQQPLITPEFTEEFRATKYRVGDTYAFLTDRMSISGKSTIKLDVLAEWKEPLDELLPEPQESTSETISSSNWELIARPSNAHAFEVPITPDETIVERLKPEVETMAAFIPPGMRHEFGDTKHRRVTYQAIATTRFKDYFSPEIRNDPEMITRKSAKVTINIPNSARPAAPKVLYVIPTFGWEIPTTTGSEIKRKRYGGGLRMYMERPWFSSGEGELLGVVLWRKPKSVLTKSSQIPDKFKPYVTQWGMDPIWLSRPTYDTPSLQNFKKKVAEENDLSLDELPLIEHPDALVSVAGHEVVYDEKRQLWYCDLEIDAGPSYYPFVRLALARYQPNSIQDAHLSRVVLADFAQLAPDRTAAITFDSTNPEVVTVSVSGIAYGESEVGTIKAGANQVEVSVEKRRSGVEGDLGWIPVPKATFQLEPRPMGEEWVWTGKVTLPAKRGSEPFRLVIKEYEVFFVDPEGTSKDRRLVYADVLVI